MWPRHLLIPLVGGDRHFKSIELWFSKIFPDIKYIGWGLKKGIFHSTIQVHLKKLKSVLTITEILIFQVSSHFSMIFFKI